MAQNPALRSHSGVVDFGRTASLWPTSTSRPATAVAPATISNEQQISDATMKDERTIHKALSNYSGFVQVHVGQEAQQESFAVHQALITARSLFFKKALSGNWTESKERTVRLPEDDPTTFHVYVHLLYTNQIAVLPDLDPKQFSADGISNIRLAKLYVLAEKLQDLDTKDKVLAAAIVAFQPTFGTFNLPNRPFVQLIYGGTPPRSLARKLIVDIYARRARGFCLQLGKERHKKAWPEDFLPELLSVRFWTHN